MIVKKSLLNCVRNASTFPRGLHDSVRPVIQAVPPPPSTHSLEYSTSVTSSITWLWRHASGRSVTGGYSINVSAALPPTRRTAKRPALLNMPDRGLLEAAATWPGP